MAQSKVCEFSHAKWWICPYVTNSQRVLIDDVAAYHGPQSGVPNDSLPMEVQALFVVPQVGKTGEAGNRATEFPHDWEGQRAKRGMHFPAKLDG